jgi:poly(3-hydroxybutyrate) depolymerase
MAAVAHPWADRQDGLPSPPPPVEWPGATPLPGDPMQKLSGVHCTTTEAAPVLAAAATANARTPWTSGDARWEVGFRPLLPDEETCDDLVLR